MKHPEMHKKVKVKKIFGGENNLFFQKWKLLKIAELPRNHVSRDQTTLQSDM